MRPLFHSDQDCLDRLQPGKPMFFNVYRGYGGNPVLGSCIPSRGMSNHAAWSASEPPPYRIVVKAKATPSPEENAA